ncbi:hypothetical protein LTR36_001997 [Oleoguttula mirabilis]|uniref:Uncharacterized protein n=1 Tax=Oleoguttula mirabilis TaxID=1507867 RepID=A0AAV9JMU9_9PEZI|nr:hypothetical protein LTR36_001997 [Oleoguttula mirabilis]
MPRLDTLVRLLPDTSRRVWTAHSDFAGHATGELANKPAVSPARDPAARICDRLAASTGLEAPKSVFTPDSRIGARVTSYARTGDILARVDRLDRFSSPLVHDRTCLILRRSLSPEDDLCEIVGQAILEPGFQICTSSDTRGCKCLFDPSDPHSHVDEEDIVALLGQDRTRDEENQQQLFTERLNVRVTASKRSWYALATSQAELEKLASDDWRRVTQAGMANVERMAVMFENFLSAANNQ